MKTPEEVAKLKADWASDPSWDLENTEGFEDHRDELLAFRSMREEMLERRSREEASTMALKWGITLSGNYPLTFGKQMQQLLDRIEVLEKRMRVSILL